MLLDIYSGMKKKQREKVSKENHAWRHDGYWYNFCIKCGIKQTEGKFQKCHTEQLEIFENSHQFENGVCVKCGMVQSKTYAFHVENKKAYVYYTEETHSRVKSRFWCNPMYPGMVGKIEIGCPLSDTEHKIKEIIL